MILGFTGHRPNSLPGTYSERTYQALLDTANFVISQYRPDTVVSGMALGWDTAVAECAINRCLKLVAAIPFRGQESRWTQASQVKYLELLNRASYIEIVSDGNYTTQAMQLRNQWIVHQSDQLMALLNQGQGGTRNCVNYAISINRPTFNCWNTFMHFYS